MKLRDGSLSRMRWFYTRAECEYLGRYMAGRSGWAEDGFVWCAHSR